MCKRPDSVTQASEEVISVVEDRGTSTYYQIRSKYVIGCDGAKSQVRSALGIESIGEDSCK
jgi:2-polyprenyl-6-methoxyphenol hydroxylase-like FAD-dependent oxidoreductase